MRIPLIGLQQQASSSQLIYALLSPAKLWCIPAGHIQITPQQHELPASQTTVRETLLLHFLERVCPASSSPACHHTALSLAVRQADHPHSSTSTAHPLGHSGMLPWEVSDQNAEKNQ